MTTIVTSTIGTTGRDYSLASSWADAADADISLATGTDKQWIGECYNDATIAQNGTSVKLDSTQGATSNMILRCATGQSFKDHANKLTNALRPNQSNGVLLSFNASQVEACFGLQKYAVVQDIQVSSTGNYSLTDSGGTDTVADMAKLVGVLAKLTAVSIGRAVNTKRCSLINCAIIVGNNSFGLDDEGSSAGRVSSCTIVNNSGSSTGKGINTSGIVVGTAVFGFGADNTISGSSSNNATDRASFGGGSSNQVNLTSYDGTDLYDATSSTEDLRAKSAGSLDLNGIRDQTWTADLDIVGQARSTSTPTIGAWEVVEAGASAVPVLMMHYN